MSLKDREFYKSLEHAYNSHSGRLFQKLTQTRIANYMAEGLTTLNKGLAIESDWFTCERLDKLFHAICNDPDPAIRRIAKIVANFHEKKYIEKREYFDYLGERRNIMMNTDIRALMSHASAVFIIANRKSEFIPHISELFSSRTTRQLNIVVCKEDASDTIQVIEQCAYSKNGNFTDRLSINLFESDEEPIAEMVGGVINGEFRAFLQQDEGFVQMSEFGKAFLAAEEQSLTELEPVWSLLRSADARGIERLRRELDTIKCSLELAPEIDGFLAAKVASYEASESIGEYQRSDLWHSFSSEIRGLHGDRIASDFGNSIEWLILKS